MEDIVEDAPATAYKVTAGELRQFIERFERLDQEKKDIADQQKEVMAEARARGYDVKVLRIRSGRGIRGRLSRLLFP